MVMIFMFCFTHSFHSGRQDQFTFRHFCCTCSYFFRPLPRRYNLLKTMQCKTERKCTCCFVIGIPVTIQTAVYVPLLHSFKDRITDRLCIKV